jgi:heme O synthase-like polyprenyltransferase
MDIMVSIISIFIILSKYFDCHSTALKIRQVEDEKNPIARKIMLKYGIKTTIWAIFLLSVLIVGLSLMLIYVFYNNLWSKITYVIVGLLVSIVQIAVARNNYSGKTNFLTRILLRKLGR